MPKLAVKEISDNVDKVGGGHDLLHIVQSEDQNKKKFQDINILTIKLTQTE